MKNCDAFTVFYINYNLKRFKYFKQKVSKMFLNLSNQLIIKLQN